MFSTSHSLSIHPCSNKVFLSKIIFPVPNNSKLEPLAVHPLMLACAVPPLDTLKVAFVAVALFEKVYVVVTSDKIFADKPLILRSLVPLNVYVFPLIPPLFIEVVETEPVIKGQTVSSSYKPAILDNGVRTGVPPFVGVGDKIVVATSDGSYVERAK